MVTPGQVLARKYRIERVLGEGGMGLLVAATDLTRQDQVALKLMRTEALGSPELRERFRREAATASRLTGENVARVRDMGTLEGGQPYLVMELLDGDDVATMLERVGKLPVGLAVEFAVQVCGALAEAHAIGIVHRDVSPSNVFVSRTPNGPLVKVLDFGVATAGAEGSPVSLRTRTGTVLGCPLYASPEQLQSSKHVDPRSDLWSLGAVMYEMVTGRTPWVADSLGGLLGAMMLTEPDPPRSLRPEVPPELEVVILKCLTRERENRFASATELAAALAPFRPSRRVSLPPSPAAPASVSHTASPPTKKNTTPWIALVVIVLVLAVLGAGVWIWTKKRATSGVDGLHMLDVVAEQVVHSRVTSARHDRIDRSDAMRA